MSSLYLYLSSSPLPASLMLLNLLALVSVWWLNHDSRNAIKLQPKELAAHLLKAQESERQHLSRELHDDIGQLLTAATLQTLWLQRRVPEDLQSHCQGLCNLLEETLGKVRDVSSAFNPRQVTSLGLEASLRGHLIKTLENTRLLWTFECQQRLDEIPQDMAVAVFRVAQESVTNVLRHAQANNLVVKLHRQPQGLLLEVCDDGLGFAPSSNPAQVGQRGMAGMLERIEQLDGRLLVTSQEGSGTRIEALFPWPHRSRERAHLNKTP